MKDEREVDSQQLSRSASSCGDEGSSKSTMNSSWASLSDPINDAKIAMAAVYDDRPAPPRSPAKKLKKHLRTGFRIFASMSYKNLREPEAKWKRSPMPAKEDVFRRGDEPYSVLWIDDDDVIGCMLCQVPFGMYFRRHHCRTCGDAVCSDCSKAREEVYGLEGKHHRVCDACLFNGVWVRPHRGARSMPDKGSASRGQPEDDEEDSRVASNQLDDDNNERTTSASGVASCSVLTDSLPAISSTTTTEWVANFDAPFNVPPSSPTPEAAYKQVCADGAGTIAHLMTVAQGNDGDDDGDLVDPCCRCCTVS
ncbi:Aste57867_21058 [Aphanomyces stellatus]|uniref:Aste57867_21058 protein n=1 Tax=Aphanomyces stellatus TaxID=120398 RepID=A0A485LIM8_9STRA|nr:hypothetical protein As57867_020990 [Aphanomyces stellatus]VFT97733.1 Aste57867_21058 [Aphanomyces stellatus]